MAKIKHLLFVCGETSGDLNAASLVKAIKEIQPQIRISGVGGAHLRKTGAEIFQDIRDLSVMGLFDVLKKLPKFFSLKKLILQKIDSDHPDAVILVDFSGFNLRLAKAINKKIPVIYYICPQVWASRKGRVKTIKEFISKPIVIFKFEEEFYKKLDIKADFVGHPLLDIIRPTLSKEAFLTKHNLSAAKTTIGLLPGSRKSEIKNILPVMLETAGMIQKEIPETQFIIAKPENLEKVIYEDIIKNHAVKPAIIEGLSYDCINASDFCLVCSGTATLETAILEKPFALVYKMNLLNYLLYRPQVKIPYIGMVNIVAQKMIIPEFIQSRANAEKISSEVLDILRNPSRISQMKNELSRIKSLLGEKGAASRAGKIILNFLGDKNGL